mmetsp:Transcript_23058/g.50589  ORF Transcript_23058/g.50589 Transcript_23058/m.50589 type:complete len:236 (+) Transcript_23058:148-855(+)
MLAVLIAALALGTGVDAITRELYTTNAVCKQRYCVNPVFPALQELPNLELARWKKHSLSNVSQWMEFCGPFVNYDPAIQQRAESEVQQDVAQTYDKHVHFGVQDLVVKSDRDAAKMYFFHLSGMGIEAWDHTKPEEESSHPLRLCARSVARMTCQTYFPRALPNLLLLEETSYARPCRSSCESYVQACNVECCDEGVQCVWDESAGKRTMGVDGKEVLLETGYVDAVSPSLQCTG